jgi:hypothetical protein
MKTCLLIDGSDNPVAVRLNDSDVKQAYIQWGRAGQTAQQFKFMQAEGSEQEIRVYRIVSPALTDEVFLESMTLEVDKIVNPAKYRKIERENENRRRQAAAA